MYRVLITGSRTWQSLSVITAALQGIADVRGSDVILVSGACPKGADLLCELEARKLDWTISRHPANWDKFGKRAGFIRNDLMVALGADLCVAFIRDESIGATYTANAAIKAGIPTTIFREGYDMT